LSQSVGGTLEKGRPLKTVPDSKIQGQVKRLWKKKREAGVGKKTNVRKTGSKGGQWANEKNKGKPTWKRKKAQSQTSLFVKTKKG